MLKNYKNRFCLCYIILNIKLLKKAIMSKKTPIPLMPWAAKHQWQIKPLNLLIISVAMAIMGIGEGLLVSAKLGNAPWTVLSQGLALQTGMSLGMAIALISVIVLLFWIPFKLKFGLGTILNVLIISFFIDFTTQSITPPEDLTTRIFFMCFGIIIFGIGTAFYLSCKLGAGPRDGLMVGICQKYGWNVGKVRTGIEVSVCGFGIWLGGTFGISTILFALSVGWIIQGTYLWLEKRFPISI